MSTISDLQKMLREYKRSNPYGYSNLRKKYTRRDRVVLKSGYFLGEAYGNLRKCWRGYKIAKNDGDEEKMIYYAKGIQKFECELGLDVEDFSSLGIVCDAQSNKMKEEDDFICNYRNNERAAEDDSDLTVEDYDNYDDYLCSLPMGTEPISEREFYQKRQRNNQT